MVDQCDDDYVTKSAMACARIRGMVVMRLLSTLTYSDVFDGPQHV